VRENTFFERELVYLESKGYQITPVKGKDGYWYATKPAKSGNKNNPLPE
jgi:hypothetical protein